MTALREAFGEFFSRQSGQDRRKWLDKKASAVGDALQYYLGPGVPVEPMARMADMMNPVADVGRSMQSAQEMVGADMTPRERFNAGLSMATDVAAVTAPAVSAGMVNRMGGNAADTATQAGTGVMDSVLGFAPGRGGAAADTVVQRANQRGPVPTMYSNPVGGSSPKGIRAYHGSPHQFDRLSMEEAGRDALWFSNDKGYAEGLAGRTNLSRRNDGSVFEVDLNLRNPLEIDTPGEARRALEDAGIDVSNMSAEEIEETFRGGENFEFLADMYKDEMASGGYDGLLFRNTYDGYGRPTDQYVVFDENLIGQPAPQGIRAYHGSPHEFDRFQMDKIGTGEGAQAYGHGLYFAENENVARQYKDALSGNDPASLHAALYNMDDVPEHIKDSAFNYQSDPNADRLLRYLENTDASLAQRMRDRLGGSMYEVNIKANPDDFLDWDAPLSEQGPKVREALLDAPEKERQSILNMLPEIDGSMSHDDYMFNYGPQLDAASRLKVDPSMMGESIVRNLGEQRMRDAGIPGIKYRDAGSRGTQEGTRNFVVFDENLVEIVRKYGIAGAAALLGMSASEVQAAMGADQ